MGTSVFGTPPGASSVFAGPPGGAAAGPGLFGPGIPIWGPIVLHPSLAAAASVVFGSGIETSPGHVTSTSSSTLSSGLLFDIGSHWTLDYFPSYTIYYDSVFQNNFSDGLVLSGSTTYEDWAFYLSQTYATADTPLIETGVQTSQTEYGTSIGAARQLISKLSLNLGVSQDIRIADQFNTVESWTGSSGLNYQFLPQFGMGVSLSGGYDDVNIGSSLPFEEIQGTMNFRPGKRLSLTLSGGAEDMQFVHPSAPSLITPIFSAALRYQLFPDTSISLAGSRSVSPSYFANQVEVVTSVGGSISQKLSQKLSLSIGAGYSTEPLTSIEAGPLPQYFLGNAPTTTLVVDRQDSSSSFSVGLSYAIIPRGSFSVFYSYGENSSSQSNFKYSSSQYGLSLSYSF